jgi:hypothetical protein
VDKTGGSRRLLANPIDANQTISRVHTPYRLGVGNTGHAKESSDLHVVAIGVSVQCTGVCSSSRYTHGISNL